MSLGVLLLADSERILLSRLLGPGDAHPDQPLFYYLAFVIVGVGFCIAVTGILGCWASCLFNCCITTTVRILYFCSFHCLFSEFPNVIFHDFVNFRFLIAN